LEVSMRLNRKTGLGTLFLIALSCLAVFTCKATGVNSVSDPLEGGVRSVKTVRAFSVTEPVEADGVIDEAKHIITVNVPFGTAVDDMTVSFDYTGASVEPAANATGIDFTGPQTFTVTALNGSKQAYVVTVNVGSNISKEISDFKITAPLPLTVTEPAIGTIADGTIALTVPFGTELDSMTVSISHSGMEVSPDSGASVDFRTPTTFTVTAADTTTRQYTVTVTVAADPSLSVYKSTNPKVTITVSPSPDYTVTDESDAYIVAASGASSLTGKSVTVQAAVDTTANANGTVYSFKHWSDGSTAASYTFAFNPASFTELRASVVAYLSHEVIQQIVAGAQAALAACDYVIGNPAENTGAAVEISALAGELNTLLQGETQTREIPIEGEALPRQETYTVYDDEALTAKAGELQTLLAANPGLRIIVQEMVFSYTGTGSDAERIKTAKLYSAGSYEFELTGGAGGHTWTSSNMVASGGKGGHVYGKKSFPANTDVTVRVGGQGEGTATYNQATAVYKKVSAWQAAKPGGWNGGGTGGLGSGAVGAAGSGGGGATDIRTGGDDVSNRILVAAGGGGASMGNGSGMVATRGGNALPDPGATAEQISGAAGRAVYNGTFNDQTTVAPQPGISPDENGLNGRNSQPGLSMDGEGRGGGGGGKNGGGAIVENAYRWDGTTMNSSSGNIMIGSGAGGTNYIDGGFTDTVNSVVPGNQWDNGTARIRWVE
jgi:hypothetical protein